MTRTALLFALAAACGSSEPSDDSPLAPPAEGEGFQLSFEAVAPPGSEIWLCQISELPEGGFTPVNVAESVQNDGMHHMDIMALTLTGVSLEPGVYDCAELYDTYSSLMDSGIFLYASQKPEQSIQLPEGVVANLPPKIKVMHEMHYVNTTDQPVEVFSMVNVYRYDGEIRDTIWGGAVRDDEINIPPMSEHTEWTRCVMSDDIDLLFLSSHTHQLGLEVVVRTFDGEQVGDVIYRNTDWETPALLSFGAEPLSLPAGTGLEFSCRFRNDTDQVVNWGFSAAEEMCQIALVFTPGEAARECVPVASSDGLHESP